MTTLVQINKRNTSKQSSLLTCTHKQWQKDALSIRPNNSDASLLLPVAKDLAKCYLSNQMKDQISQINQRGRLSHLHLTSLPRDPNLPPTPLDGKRPDTKKTWVSEIVQLGIIAYALESQVFSYFEQKDGALVQDIAPIKGLENSQSNSSSGKFSWHSDDANFKRDFRAEGIMLCCLRNEGGTATLFASVDEITNAMNPIDLKVLRQPRFRVRTPESFKLYDGKVIYSEPRPILTEGEAGTEIAIATYNVQPVDPQDEEATSALWALHLALRPPVAKSFVLEPGDVLIISNVCGLHARSPISGDRWLQRCYFRKDLTALRRVTNSTDNCRVFSSEKLFLL
jgi:hypothetical protein